LSARPKADVYDRLQRVGSSLSVKNCLAGRDVSAETTAFGQDQSYEARQLQSLLDDIGSLGRGLALLVGARV